MKFSFSPDGAATGWASLTQDNATGRQMLMVWPSQAEAVADMVTDGMSETEAAIALVKVDFGPAKL
jgi:hypothetical protein